VTPRYQDFDDTADRDKRSDAVRSTNGQLAAAPAIIEDNQEPLALFDVPRDTSGPGQRKNKRPARFSLLEPASNTHTRRLPESLPGRIVAR
jgi:hypothetical protein